MLRRFAPALLVLTTFILDTTVLPIVYGGVYAVPLTVVAVLLIGMLMGRMRGLLYGTIGGLLIDITSGTLGMMTFFFMAAGFLVGLILHNENEPMADSPRGERRRLIARFVWVFVFYALGEMALFVIQYFSSAVFEWRYFAYIAVRALLCAALATALYPMFSRLLLGGKSARRKARSQEVKSF